MFFRSYGAPHHGTHGLAHSLMPHNQSLLEHGIDVSTAFGKAKTLYSSLPFSCFPNLSDLKTVDLSSSGIKFSCLGASCSVPLPDTPFSLKLTFNFCDKQDDILYLSQYMCIDELSSDLKLLGTYLKAESSYIYNDYDSILSKMGLASNGCFQGPIEWIDFTTRKGEGYWAVPPFPVTPFYIIPEIDVRLYITVKTSLPTTQSYVTTVTIFADFTDTPGIGDANVTVLNAVFQYGNTKSFTLKSTYNPPQVKLNGGINW